MEALARAGVFKREYLEKARLLFEQTLGYANHLVMHSSTLPILNLIGQQLYSEQLGKHGEHLGTLVLRRA